MWTADFSILLFTRNSVLRGVARSQHSGMFQLINSLLKPCYIWHNREKKKKLNLLLKSLPINSQIHSWIHDLARIHLVVSDRNSSWMSLCKKQWPKKKKKKWFIGMILKFLTELFKKFNQAFWLSSQVRKQGHQLPKFPRLDHQTLLNMYCWDKKTRGKVLMCPHLFKSPLQGHQSSMTA